MTDGLPARVAIVGGGVIGAGWAARFVLNGVDVAFFDPSPTAAQRAGAILEMARAAWARLFPAATTAEGRMTFHATLDEALEGATFVQESLPENEELKRTVLARIDAALPADVVIGSSTSGLLPTRLQAGLRHPERLVVGHPFNPVYLLPLVEVCGGERTTPETKEKAAAIYRRIGMQVLDVRKEIDGFIADRLLEAVWREGLWLIEEGVATTSELDDAIRYGAGLRWAFMGTFLTYRLAGGDAGMHHFLKQFGPALKLPWTKLVAPELTDELVERIATQSDEQAQGVPVRDLEVLRDDALVRIMQALSHVGTDGYAAGRTLNDFRKVRAHAAGADVPADGRLITHRCTVVPEWIDYNGHMTEHRYLQVFGDATDGLLAMIGADGDYVASGYSFYTVESHLRHLGQGYEGMKLEVQTRILDFDAKRLHIFHQIMDAATGEVLATAEQMLMHVDAEKGKTCPAPETILEIVRKIHAAEDNAEKPQGAGSSIMIRRKPT